MKVETIKQTPKVSSAKLGIYCTVFCLVAGLIFGTLKATDYPVNPFGMGLVSFAWTLFWCGLLFALLKCRAGSKRAPLVILGMYAVNILISLFVCNFCQLGTERHEQTYGLMGDFDLP